MSLETYRAISGTVISPYEQILDDVRSGYTDLSSTFTVQQRQIANNTQLFEKIEELGNEFKKMQTEMRDARARADKKSKNYFVIGTLIGIAGIIIGIAMALFM